MFARDCYQQNYEPAPMPRPVLHKVISLSGLAFALMGLLVTFGCVEADQETSIALVTALATTGVLVTVYGFKTYFRFGGKIWL